MSETSLQVNSTPSSKELVQILNDNMADLMVPAVVYIVILMVTGTIGNIMVCFYYGFKTKFTPNSLFVVVLAAYDLTVCIICMPTEIADIELYYTFENDAACKTLRLINYLAGIGSILTLVAIAVDRYRRIRTPTRKQMSVKTAAVVSVVLICIAVLFSWPSAVLYGSIEVEIPNDAGRNITGFDCTSTKDKSSRHFVWAFYGIHVVMFVICTIILVTLYAIIGVSVCKHRRKMNKYGKSTKGQMTLQSPPRSSENTSQKDLLPDERDHRSTNEARASSFTRESPIKNNKENPGRKSAIAQVDTETIKVTMVMVAITTLFVLSFLPYLSLSVWRVIKGEHEARFLSGSGLVGFKIGSRSFLLNSALNPWIYGIFNSKFRQYYHSLLCCKNN